jgi:hypothetical protein
MARAAPAPPGEQPVIRIVSFLVDAMITSSPLWQIRLQKENWKIGLKEDEKRHAIFALPVDIFMQTSIRIS